MKCVEELSETIKQLYRIIEDLENDYSVHERHFTLDGHLLGSIGEVYAAERYNIKLFTSSAKRHDGVTNDKRERLVQIKVTQAKAKKKVIGLSSKPDWLLVLQLSEAGTFREVYNGPGGVVWELVKYKPKPSNGQYQIALSKLEELNESVAHEDRI